MPAPQDEYEGALRIVGRHFRVVMRELAEEVIENQEEFDKGRFGTQTRYSKNTTHACIPFASFTRI
jgi:hypothetical protein